jgi:ATP-dependent DNA helicase RecG
LPKGLSVRDLGKISIRRNELIADLFFRLHKVERIGMGISKMRDAMLEADLREPIFEPDSFFRAIFYRSPEFAMKEGSPEMEAVLKKKDWKTTQKTTQKIIALIENKPEITRQELAIEIAISDDGIKYHLKKMQEKGLLRRVGPDKSGHWKIIRQPRFP